MHETVNDLRFAEVMRNHGFSYYGALTLFRILEDYEDMTGQTMEFDPVAIRCEFREYGNVMDAAADFFGRDEASKIDEEEAEDRLLDEAGSVYPIIYNGRRRGVIVQPY